MGESNWIGAIIGVAFSCVAAGLTWLLADSQSKGRLEGMRETVNSLEEEQDKISKAFAERVTNSETKIVRLEMDRNELLRMIERLDNLKASKEMFDAFKTEVSTLRSEMDRRFDRLERLIVKSNSD